MMIAQDERRQTKANSTKKVLKITKQHQHTSESTSESTTPTQKPRQKHQQRQHIQKRTGKHKQSHHNHNNNKLNNNKQNKQNNNNNKSNNRRNNNKNKSRKPTSNSVKGLVSSRRNTESFKPEDYLSPPDVRIVFGAPTKKYGKTYSVHDVVMTPELFCKTNDYSIYDALLMELEASGLGDSLFVEWHGDTHVIADDKKAGGKWKKNSPTFQRVVQQIRDYFNMDIKATRFNWYRNAADWKPFHHDAAAMKANFAKIQNCTVAASFGDEREVGFEHAQKRTMVHMPLPNGSMYAFGRDVNVEWRHGVVPLPQEQVQTRGGRISIIAWGWVEQVDIDQSRVRNTP
jgi:hypothetical protein